MILKHFQHQVQLWHAKHQHFHSSIKNLAPIWRKLALYIAQKHYKPRRSNRCLNYLDFTMVDFKPLNFTALHHLHHSTHCRSSESWRIPQTYSQITTFSGYMNQMQSQILPMRNFLWNRILIQALVWNPQLRIYRPTYRSYRRWSRHWRTAYVCKVRDQHLEYETIDFSNYIIHYLRTTCRVNGKAQIEYRDRADRI